MNKLDIKPHVSIIMNCHNSETYLNEAIDSVLEQTFSDWELILWDNNSSDRTKDIVKEYKDHRIKYFFSEIFCSLGEARNLAIEESKGQLIAFLDSDDLWLPQKLEQQVPIFNDKKIGIVICDTIFFNEKGLEKQLYKKGPPPNGSVFRETLSDYFISLETAIIRKDSLDSLEYWFDTRFQVIEEYDLFVRLAYKWEIAYVDKILAKWRVHGSSWTWSKSELFPIEKKKMLKSLSKLIPDFYDSFSIEIKKVNQGIIIEETKNIWQNKSRKEARRHLVNNFSFNFKFIIIYILSFLPRKLFNFFQQLRGAIEPI
jgi:glycosyltransferase involved in cell wall biosynthesis